MDSVEVQSCLYCLLCLYCNKYIYIHDFGIMRFEFVRNRGERRSCPFSAAETVTVSRVAEFGPS